MLKPETTNNTNRMLMSGKVASDNAHEEFRVAISKSGILYSFFTELLGQAQKIANVYKGTVTNIEPSLEAVFVDYGAERHGFLPFKEIADIYLRSMEDGQPSSIRDRLKVGMELMVQVDKEERGNKGAALTTFISLAGCYLVLMPNNPEAGGISRRIEGDERETLKEVLAAMTVPDNMGIIVRTAGVGKSIDELRWDLSILLKQWEAIQQAYQSRPAPFLIHQESDIIVRAIRDYMREDIEEILVDNYDAFVRVQQYVQQVRPDFIPRVKLYQSNVPLFSRYQIESQIEEAFQHEVRLPSGGAIVIDRTEALVSIDINSSRSTRGGDIEETAFHTNLEAADEIARQLRIRDIGGLIVIDFIDMNLQRNQREVEERLRRALEADRARVQIGRISRFGLLEMSRQRLRTSLGETSQNTCPRCLGHGSIRNVPSLAFSILRLVEEEALKENTAEVRVQLPIDVATFIINEKRESLLQIENRHQTRLLIIPNAQLFSPHYKIDRLRQSDMNGQKENVGSYQITYSPEAEDTVTSTKKEKRAIEEPAVKTIPISEPHPKTVYSKPKPSILKRLISGLFTKKPEKPLAAKTETPTQGPFQQRKRHYQKPRSQQRTHHPHKRRRTYPQPVQHPAVETSLPINPENIDRPESVPVQEPTTSPHYPAAVNTHARHPKRRRRHLRMHTTHTRQPQRNKSDDSNTNEQS